jgi:hypothetical protein
MDDTQQMLINELQRTERALGARRKLLSRLQEQQQQRSQPRRYVLEFDVEPATSQTGGVTTTDLSKLGRPNIRSFLVDRDCKRFVCQDVVVSVAAVGRIAGVTNSNKLTLPVTLTDALDFTCSIRDTSSDREWQSHPLHRYFLASGILAGMPLPWGAFLRPGAEIEVILVPITSRAVGVTGFVSGANVNSVLSYSVQVSFVGYEVL